MQQTKIWLVVDAAGGRLMQAVVLTHIPRVGEQLNFRDTGMATVRQVLHATHSPIGSIALYLDRVSPREGLPIVPELSEPWQAETLRDAGWRDFQPVWWTGKVDTSV